MIACQQFLVDLIPEGARAVHRHRRVRAQYVHLDLVVADGDVYIARLRTSFKHSTSIPLFVHS